MIVIDIWVDASFILTWVMVLMRALIDDDHYHDYDDDDQNDDVSTRSAKRRATTAAMSPSELGDSVAISSI